jgi:hypothetical protein
VDDAGRLRIYLNDHLATTLIARELARRSLRRNRRSDLGAFLERYLAENAEEREAVRDAMRRVHARRQPYKEPAAWAAERVGRLKPNGQLTGYSPLSRLVEIEGLAALLAGSRLFWLALGALPDRRLAGIGAAERAERAGRQARELERIGAAIAPDALGYASRRPRG